MHQIVYSNKAALDQLLEGLHSHNVIKLLEGNLSLAMALFTCNEQETMTATVMRKLVKPEPSPEGSNARSREEEIILHWFRFLEDVDNDAVSVGR